MTATGLPQPADIRELLEGYGIETQRTIVLTGTLVSGSAVVSGIDTRALARYMNLFGVGIPAAAQIATVDLVGESGQITMTAPATAEGTDVAITATYFCVVSDKWIQDRIDRLIIPYVKRITRLSFDGIETVTEYYDGTGSPIMVLRRRPIVQIIAISYTNVDANFYYLTPTALQVIKEEGILKAKANFNESSYIPIFFKGDRNIRIQYQYGFDTCPADVSEAIARLTASEVLGHVAGKLGGGNIGTQGFNPNYGENGKYTQPRKDLVKTANALLRAYMTGAGA
jgi:hypothetical protein